MAVQSSTFPEEPAPYSGDLRIKVWCQSNDYTRMQQVFIGKVDARGQIVYNLRISQVAGGQRTYNWQEVDPMITTPSIEPLIEFEQGITPLLYKALLEHLIKTGWMVPPTSTSSEDVERKMLISENQFLRDLVDTLAGTRRKESWLTTSIEDLPNDTLDLIAARADREMEIRQSKTPPRGLAQSCPPGSGTPTTSGGTGGTGHWVPSGHLGGLTTGIPSVTRSPLGTLVGSGASDRFDHSEVGSGDVEDRGGS